MYWLAFIERKFLFEEFSMSSTCYYLFSKMFVGMILLQGIVTMVMRDDHLPQSMRDMNAPGQLPQTHTIERGRPLAPVPHQTTTAEGK